VAKFITGVIVGIFLGATASVYGAGACRPGIPSGWTVAKNSPAIVITDRLMSVGRTSNP